MSGENVELTITHKQLKDVARDVVINYLREQGEPTILEAVKDARTMIVKAGKRQAEVIEAKTRVIERICAEKIVSEAFKKVPIASWYLSLSSVVREVVQAAVTDVAKTELAKYNITSRVHVELKERDDGEEGQNLAAESGGG